MKIVSIVGTRPQYIKLVPIVDIFSESTIEHSWIDTGQHYSENLSRNILDDIGLIPPIKNLMVGSGSHAEQTAKMLLSIEGYLQENNYDAVIVYGDTNSTLAGALAASKLGLPVIHIEAGLRSTNMGMPEEINRRIVDHISSLHFAPTQEAVSNLIKEGIFHPVFSGDVMFDSLQKFMQKNKSIPNVSGEKYILATIHRAENTDNESRLRSLIERLCNLPYKVELAAHPRLLKQIFKFGIETDSASLNIIEPLDYSNMLRKIVNAQSIITDSGGIQKEAYMLRKTCITIRTETEWPETTDSDWNVLDFELQNAAKLVNRPTPLNQRNFFGDGQASLKIHDSIVHFLSTKR